MPIETRLAIGMAMARTAWLAIVIAPIWGWAQPSGTSVVPSEASSVGSTKPITLPNSSAIHEVNLLQVSDRLGLSASQQNLWEVFKSRVDAYSGTYYRQKPIVPSPEDAATRQIGRMVDNLQNRLAALEDIEIAAKNLYASLTPTQQKTANELLILTIPRFSASSGESVYSTEDGGRKEGKSGMGKHSRRGGASGSNGGPMIEN